MAERPNDRGARVGDHRPDGVGSTLRSRIGSGPRTVPIFGGDLHCDRYWMRWTESPDVFGGRVSVEVAERMSSGEELPWHNGHRYITAPHADGECEQHVPQYEVEDCPDGLILP